MRWHISLWASHWLQYPKKISLLDTICRSTLSWHLVDTRLTLRCESIVTQLRIGWVLAAVIAYVHLSQYINQLSTETWPSIGQLSTDHQPSVDQVSTKCQLSNWVSTYHWPSVNWLMTDTPTNTSAEYQPTLNRYIDPYIVLHFKLYIGGHTLIHQMCSRLLQDFLQSRTFLYRAWDTCGSTLCLFLTWWKLFQKKTFPALLSLKNSCVYRNIY